MDILWWLIVGLIAGWLAKLVVPGKEPGGFLATMLIGLAGSFLGGFLTRVLFNWSNTAGSILVAFLGSVILLMIYHAVMKNRRSA